MEIFGDFAPCVGCKGGVEDPFPFSMAFQPIVDVRTSSVYAYEALARGPEGQPSAFVLDQVNDRNRYAFDQSCRVKAITLASRLGLEATGAMLSINFMPGAVYSPAACIQVTLKAARSLSFPLDRLIFEIVEAEKVRSSEHLMAIVEEYRSCGFKVALDDFGAGWCGVNLLANVSANIVKLDMALTRNLGGRPRAVAIVAAMVRLCESLKIELIAEGIETVDECRTLMEIGVHLMQGYLFAKPTFEQLPEITFPTVDRVVA